MANEYVSSTVLKATLQISGTAGDADISLACEAASRAIDRYKNTRYFSTTETRYYSPGYCDGRIRIDDFNSLATVLMDTGGDYSYGTELTEGTDFVVEPVNAALTGEPYCELRLLPQSGRSFSGVVHGLQVTGSFGWATVPPQVQEATSILAARLYNRRNAPFGIIALGVEGTAMRLSTRMDPDVALMLDNAGGTQPRMIA